MGLQAMDGTWSRGRFRGIEEEDEGERRESDDEKGREVQLTNRRRARGAMQIRLSWLESDGVCALRIARSELNGLPHFTVSNVGRPLTL